MKLLSYRAEYDKYQQFAQQVYYSFCQLLFGCFHFFVETFFQTKEKRIIIVFFGNKTPLEIKEKEITIATF